MLQRVEECFLLIQFLFKPFKFRSELHFVRMLGSKFLSGFDSKLASENLTFCEVDAIFSEIFQFSLFSNFSKRKQYGKVWKNVFHLSKSFVATFSEQYLLHFVNNMEVRPLTRRKIRSSSPTKIPAPLVHDKIDSVSKNIKIIFLERLYVQEIAQPFLCAKVRWIIPPILKLEFAFLTF